MVSLMERPDKEFVVSMTAGLSKDGYNEERREAIQEIAEHRQRVARLIRLGPMGSGDPCLDCGSLVTECEEPCNKVLSYMRANPDLGDQFQDI